MLGIAKSEHDAEAFIDSIDTSGLGELEFEDLANYLLRRIKVKYNSEMIISSFRNLRPRYDDSKSQRHISREAVLHALTHYGREPLPPTDAKVLLEKCEVFGGPGREARAFDFEDYVRVMLMRAIEDKSKPAMLARSGAWLPT